MEHRIKKYMYFCFVLLTKNFSNMKKTLLSMLAVAAMFGMAANAFAEDIPGAKDAKAGDIGRHETASGVNEWLNPENGVYGLHTFAADANDWDSQFFIVFADAPVSKGTPISIKFDYRKDGEGAVKFNAQGHGDPHAYVNNDGWETLEATNEWKTYEAEIESTENADGKGIRTFAVNASIARENGTLYMRNIVIEVNYEEAVATKETDADAADLGEAPVIEVPVPALNAEVPYDKIGGDTAAASVAKAIFVSREEHGRFASTPRTAADSANNLKANGAQFVQSTVKYGDDKVFAFRVDTADETWGGTCLTQLFVKLESVSQSLVSGTTVILSYDFKTDLVNAPAGTFNLLSSYAGARYGTGGAPTNEWQTKTDTVVINGNPFTQWEFHLGKAKSVISYDVFLKSVKVIVAGKVVINSDDLTPVEGAEIKDVKVDDGTAVAEVAAINAYVAGNVLYVSEAADVVIYNINGVAVKAAKNVTTLNVSDLKSGLYIAKVGNRVVKFVK